VRRALLALALVVCGLPVQRAIAWAEPAGEQRLALVIGNAAYSLPEPALKNPVNDARAIAAALKELDFGVRLVADANHAGMRRAIREFEDSLRKQKSVGFFYFAGHGLHVAGRNYLVPIGAHLTREDEALERAIDATELVQRLRETGSRLNIVILDACRDNPLVKPASRTRSAHSPEGLAPLRPATGTLVAFAAEPGRVAGDGAADRGMYAKHLVRYMRTPGLSLEQVFKRVREAVEKESKGSQVPVEFSTLTGSDFYFVPPQSPGR
jgi:uncharacterized caspase-like protein